MPNPMDNANFMSAQQSAPQDLSSIINQARQNPRAFEEQIKQRNPQGYQQALQIRNSANPQAMIMQMVQQRGINPNIFGMLGIK